MPDVAVWRGAAGVEEGIASWYGNEYHGRVTASGKVFDQDAMTAAHRDYPFGTRVQVTNLRNRRTVIVRINDRGPFVRGRIIDLSRGAAGIAYAARRHCAGARRGAGVGKENVRDGRAVPGCRAGMPELSVVMIVKDEAACPGRCLASVRDIADEIVAGDTGSTDATPAIAAGFGARVIRVPWRDDFAWARNRVLAAASGDWLLHLDADEELDPDAARRIRAVVDADGAGADAIEVTLANYCDDARSWRWVAAPPGDPMARGRAGYVAAPLLRLFETGAGSVPRARARKHHGKRARKRRGDPPGTHSDPSLRIPDRRGAVRGETGLLPGTHPRKGRNRPDDRRPGTITPEQALVCGDTAAAESASRRALELAPLHLGAATTWPTSC